MTTRRQFIGATAAAAIAAAVPVSAIGKRPTGASHVDEEERPTDVTALDSELSDYVTMASAAQSVPFPNG